MKILTVEDPVEYQMPGINQIQVKPQINLTFANALRSIVRQDPDVIMIGEIRDLETAEIAVQSALTGHLVLSTVHTNDAASTMNRLLDMGVEDYLLTSTVNGVLAQRLVRTLCPHCKEAHAALPEIVEQMRLYRFTSDKEITLYRPMGCPQCAHTGYSGRISIMEMLPVTDPLRSLVMKHATATDLRTEAIREGMVTMYEDGLRKAVHGDHDVRGSAPRHARELSMMCPQAHFVRHPPAGGAQCPSGGRAGRWSAPTLASFAAPRAPVFAASRPSRGRRIRPHWMPIFSYKAVNAAGDVATGELEAANESEIVDRLRDQGMLPMQVARTRPGPPPRRRRARGPRAPRRSWFASKTVTRDQLLAITRELATLLNAGMPLDRALEILIGLAAAPPAAAMLQQIRDDVRGGKSLSQALDARRDVFSRFYMNIVRAGEAGGALGVVLTRLADTMERNKDLRESVKSALIYPTHPDRRRRAVGDGAARLGRAAVRADVRAGGQGAAAAPRWSSSSSATRCGTGGGRSAAAVVLAMWWVRHQLAQPAVRLRWDARLLRLPLVGDLVTKVEVARFARTLATLLGNGVTLLAGLAIVKETIGNGVLAGALDGVIARLREGKGFGRPLGGNGAVSRLAVQMILVGEESGRLEEMLIARRRRLRPRGADRGQAFPRRCSSPR